MNSPKDLVVYGLGACFDEWVDCTIKMAQLEEQQRIDANFEFDRHLRQSHEQLHELGLYMYRVPLKVRNYNKFITIIQY